VTRLAEEMVEGTGFEVERTPATLAALTRAATASDVVFAGSPTGGFVFPEFIPGYDGVASLCNLLELLAPLDKPLSELVDELPRSAVRHRALRCPWASKGAVMRVLTERMKDRTVATPDGLKIVDPDGWAQVLPDAAEPIVHVYTEGATEEAGTRMESELAALVEAVIAETDSPEP
jgi:mannose-1-phosphate guanylyltransferase/phosphomannomutase